MTITLPSTDWFLQNSKNTYTGSCGTDARKGFLGNESFNFRVYVEKGEDKTLLVAECWALTPSGNFVEKINEDSAKFDCDDAGREAALAWLAERAAPYNQE